MEMPNIFKGDYRLLAIPPIILILISLFFIPQIQLGVDFRGGTLITLTTNDAVDSDALQAQLASEGLDAEVRSFDTAVGGKVEIEFAQSDELVEAEELKAEFESLLYEATNLEVQAQMNGSMQGEYEAKREEIDAVADRMFGLAGDNTRAEMFTSVNDLEKEFSNAYKMVYSNYQDAVTRPISKYVDYDSISVQTVSPLLSTHFIDTALRVAAISAVLSAIFVFLFFRMIVPSIAVIVGAACDIIIALGAMGLFGIPLTLPAFAALLMLVGYSLDTDILLTTRMTKRRGDPRENAYDSMKTGLTMSLTGMIAFSVLLKYIVPPRSSFTPFLNTPI